MIIKPWYISITFPHPKGKKIYIYYLRKLKGINIMTERKKKIQNKITHNAGPLGEKFTIFFFLLTCVIPCAALHSVRKVTNNRCSLSWTWAKMLRGYEQVMTNLNDADIAM